MARAIFLLQLAMQVDCGDGPCLPAGNGQSFIRQMAKKAKSSTPHTYHYYDERGKKVGSRTFKSAQNTLMKSGANAV